ncbi:hypothetical protein EVAR_62177_1 [Eumeta japonica]|uniref:Uncharacterized protein n=1 Tax=Eumeta variegata TaxID=151549 RepID=A0A4C1ZW28_EUMVA|nr:hypothetical protein EVAR_62177_1 [Eumeta japonica]
MPREARPPRPAAAYRLSSVSPSRAAARAAVRAAHACRLPACRVCLEHLTALLAYQSKSSKKLHPEPHGSDCERSRVVTSKFARRARPAPRDFDKCPKRFNLFFPRTPNCFINVAIRH